MGEKSKLLSKEVITIGLLVGALVIGLFLGNFIASLENVEVAVNSYCRDEDLNSCCDVCYQLEQVKCYDYETDTYTCLPQFC